MQYLIWCFLLQVEAKGDAASRSRLHVSYAALFIMNQLYNSEICFSVSGCPVFVDRDKTRPYELISPGFAPTAD